MPKIKACIYIIIDEAGDACVWLKIFQTISVGTTISYVMCQVCQTNFLPHHSVKGQILLSVILCTWEVI